MELTIPARRITIAALVGGLILFVWGAVAWMVIPLRMSSIKQLPNEKQMLASLQQQSAGVYFFPAKLDFGTVGPSGLLIYSPAAEGLTPGQLARSFVMNVIAAFAVAWLLARASASLSFGARVAFVTIAGGVVVSLIADLQNWNWYAYPIDYTLASIADHLVGWLLAGLALAAIVRRVPLRQAAA